MTKKRIIVSKVSKKFRIDFRRNVGSLLRLVSFFSGKSPKKEIEVLRDISFELNSGEVLGIIGDNGSGKSTLLRIISKIYKDYSGRIDLNGKVVSLINLNVGLKERLTLRQNVFLCCSLFGLSRDEIRKRFDSIVEFSELENYVDTKTYQFSEGMRQRLAFSIAIHCNPEILVLDEVFEVGDEEFRAKSGEKIMDLVGSGCSVVLVSHDLEIVKKYCKRVIWIDNGKIAMDGESHKVVSAYVKASRNKMV